MDLYNLVTKIPYLIMLGIGLLIVIQLYIGGLQNLSADVETVSKQDYRKAVILEDLLNIDANSSELSATSESYRYDQRRAVLPAEYFTNEKDSEEEIGFNKRNGHCYIEKVKDLNGRDFGFFLNPTGEFNALRENAEDPRGLECATQRPNSVYSPAILIRKANNNNPPVEVNLHVYPIG